MIFPLMWNHSREIKKADAIEVSQARSRHLGRYRAILVLDCQHEVEVDYPFDTTTLTARVRARAAALALSLETGETMVCPRCSA